MKMLLKNENQPSGGSALVRRGVGRTLFAMAFPLLAGTFAMNAYNLTDTWFVAQLGTLPLAAMGFTFPVVMLLTCVALGIGTALTTLVSHAIGRHDHDDAGRLVTHGLTLILCVAACLSVAGYLLVVPVFRALGADVGIQPLIASYMRVWYIGSVFMAIPMVGKGLLISAGDSKGAGLCMIIGPILNTILDPIMIFGLLGCPAMGIRGAAMATVIAQAVSTLMLLHFLYNRHGLLKWAWRGFTGSMRRIVRFAIPSILSMVLMPVAATVITKILSGFGNEAVAAAGAAQRIEMFAFIIPMALGISLTPFVSQNFGAGRLDRVRAGFKTGVLFALIYGGFISAVFIITAPWLAAIFTDDPKVAGTIVLYIRLISPGYGMMESHRYCGFILTGLHRPSSATLLNTLRIMLFLIPFSWVGAQMFGLKGVFAGRLATDLLTGCVGLFWITRLLAAINSGEQGQTPEHQEIEPRKKVTK